MKLLTSLSYFQASIAKAHNPTYGAMIFPLMFGSKSFQLITEFQVTAIQFQEPVQVVSLADFPILFTYLAAYRHQAH